MDDEYYQLMGISPIDGRYGKNTKKLVAYFSEFALIKYRIFVEIAWLRALSWSPLTPLVRAFTEEEERLLDDVLLRYSLQDAHAVKEIERTTNHDVKAVEYYLRGELADTSLLDVSEMIHAGLTSEDTNSLAYSFMIADALRSVIVPATNEVHDTLLQNAFRYAEMPMPALTHGQTASPITVGIMFRVFEHRLRPELDKLNGYNISAKFGGATGTHAAFQTLCPGLDTVEFARNFVENLASPSGALLVFNPITTQIEPHDNLAELFQIMLRINTILFALCRDMRGYISRDYFTLMTIKDEVGSSTMPNKVNPQDFEMAKGNLSVAKWLLRGLAEELPESYYQRGLEDSTMMRNIGVAFAHSLIAYQAIQRGLGKITPNERVLKNELDWHWEVLMEKICNILKREGVRDAYEIVKNSARGRGAMSQKEYTDFIVEIGMNHTLAPSAQAELFQLEPRKYTGAAAELAKMEVS